MKFNNIQSSIAYFDKLRLNKGSKTEDIYNALVSFYKQNYCAIDLTFMHNKIYIAKDVIAFFNTEYLQLIDKLDSLSIKDFRYFLNNEIYNTLYVEHESSSRKAIKNIIKNTFNPDNKHTYLLEKNLLQAYRFINNAPVFNKTNLRTVYGILTTDINMQDNKLDGEFYRKGQVMIKKSTGIASSEIDKHIDFLIDYFNDGADEDYVIKALVIHTYFEMIHPYYDFNGRMGRLILLWYAKHVNKANHLLFFSTAMAHYRDQYLKIFNEAQKLLMLDMTYPVAEMLKIMIANKKNYIVLQNIKRFKLNKYKYDLSFLAKDIIMRVLAIKDIYNQANDNWIAKSTLDVYYQEYSESVIYNELHKLKTFGIVELSKSKPLKIKFILAPFIQN